MSEVDALVRTAAVRLQQAGVSSPAVDAEMLLAYVLEVDLEEVRRARILGRPVADPERVAYAELIERRAARVPLQHLTGTAHFAGVDLLVGPGVFVPRPETEVLVDLALQALAGMSSPTVLDLCTGSGAIALAIARARPDARVGAVELGVDAHRYAVANVARTGLVVDLRRGKAQDAFGDWAGTVDLVVSNPPYIPPDAVPVEVEVAEHDPELALYGGGDDGLLVPREVADRAWQLLRPGGVLLMEHADVQGQEMVQVLGALGWVRVDDLMDLAGKPRVVRAATPAR